MSSHFPLAWSVSSCPHRLRGCWIIWPISPTRVLSDLGYSVDLSVADPYVLPPPTAAKPVADAVPFCSLEGLPAPVYVDD